MDNTHESMKKLVDITSTNEEISSQLIAKSAEVTALAKKLSDMEVQVQESNESKDKAEASLAT